MKLTTLSDSWLRLAQLAVTIALLALTSVPPALAQDERSNAVPEPDPVAAPTTTLERIRATGTLRLGYRMDAQPFSYQDASGQAAGYTVSLCSKVVDQVKAELALSALAVEWVPEGRPLPNQPLCRGTPAQVLQHKNFSAVSGSAAETWLTGRITMLGILAAAVPVDSYEAGLERAPNRSSDALFGDRAILLEAAARNPAARNLRVLDRLFTVEPLALGVARGDEDLRLLVDRTLSGLYGTAEFGQLYAETFGEPDERAAVLSDEHLAGAGLDHGL